MFNRTKILATGAALASVIAFTAIPAQAEHGRNAAAAAGAIGGLAVGAAVAGAASQPRYYDAPPAGYYDDGGYSCHYERRQVMIDAARYRWQRVRVCD